MMLFITSVTLKDEAGQGTRSCINQGKLAEMLLAQLCHAALT